MTREKTGWAITGAGHFAREIHDMILSLDNVDVFLSSAAVEVMKMYKISFAGLKGKVYQGGPACAPVCGRFSTGAYRALVVAPASANTVAKFVAGIADTLVTNIFAQAGKSCTPIIALPTDLAPVMETQTPDGTRITVQPRRVDLENTSKLESFETVTVARSLNELAEALRGLDD